MTGNDRAGAVPVPARPAEVRELWAFLHGGIMDPGIRRALRAAYGFCPRHAWLYAAVEIELWQGGAGSSPGHQPFDVCVLYEDLLATALARLGGRRWHWGASPQRALRAGAACRVCAAVADSDAFGNAERPGFAGSDPVALAREVDALTHTRRWLRDTEPQWRPAACPGCRDTPVEDAAFLCRTHIVEAREHIDAVALRRRLDDVHTRLASLLSAMRADRGRVEATGSERAAWVEALGFFAGWRAPLAITATSETVA
jgi:hypothetical protein